MSITLLKKQASGPEEATEHEPADQATSPSKGKGITRRRMLGYLGIQVVAGAFAGAAMSAPKNFDPQHYNRGITPDQLPNTRAWLVTDPTTCVGCRTCEIVCSLSHDDTCQPSLARIHTLYDPQHALVKLAVMPEVCRQCNMADCYLACENEALVLDPKTGARIIDPEKCEGCGECFKACPYDMIVENETMGIFSKCDLCGGDPMCVKFCPADALKFVELG